MLAEFRHFLLLSHHINILEHLQFHYKIGVVFFTETTPCTLEDRNKIREGTAVYLLKPQGSYGRENDLRDLKENSDQNVNGK